MPSKTSRMQIPGLAQQLSRVHLGKWHTDLRCCRTVSIVEPDLAIEKTASPTFVRVGDTVTYTITIRHTGDSNTNAYDTLMQDVVPAELGIILRPLNCNAGGQNANTCAYDAGTRTVSAGWDNFTLSGGTGVVRFRLLCSKPASFRAGSPTPLQWNGPACPETRDRLSPHNVLSTERYYDPGDPGKYLQRGGLPSPSMRSPEGLPCPPPASPREW